jgi:hypothetical protein
MVLMLHELGIESHKVYFYNSRGIAVHSAVEVGVDGREALVDPSLGRLHYLPDGRLATRSDLAGNPATATLEIGTGENVVLVDFRRTSLQNWSKIPVLAPLTHRLLKLAIADRVDSLSRPVCLEEPKLLAAAGFGLAGILLFVPLALAWTSRLLSGLLLVTLTMGLGWVVCLETPSGVDVAFPRKVLEARPVPEAPARRSLFTVSSSPLTCLRPSIPEIQGLDRCDSRGCTLQVALGRLLKSPGCTEAGASRRRSSWRRALFIARSPCDAVWSGATARPDSREADSAASPAAIPGEFTPYSAHDLNLNGLADGNEEPFSPLILPADTDAVTTIHVPRVARATDCAYLAVALVSIGAASEVPMEGMQPISSFEVSGAPISLNSEIPPADRINSVRALVNAGGATVAWDTSAEFTTVGFRLIGEDEAGQRFELSRRVIPARERFSGKSASYEFDACGDAARDAVFLHVEILRTDGRGESTGPVPFARSAQRPACAGDSDLH